MKSNFSSKIWKIKNKPNKHYKWLHDNHTNAIMHVCGEGKFHVCGSGDQHTSTYSKGIRPPDCKGFSLVTFHS